MAESWEIIEKLNDEFDVVNNDNKKLRIELRNLQIENLLQKIFFNRRHLAGAGGSVSIIATSQAYNKIDAKLRKTASQIIFYKNLHKKETESLFDEVILLPKKEFVDTLRYVFKKKHDFLFIDTQAEPDKMLHKNFSRLQIRSPNITEDLFENLS